MELAAAAPQHLLQVGVLSDELLYVRVFQPVSVGEQHHGVLADFGAQHVLQRVHAGLLLLGEPSQLQGEQEDVGTWSALPHGFSKFCIHLSCRQLGGEESGRVHHSDPPAKNLTFSLPTR